MSNTGYSYSHFSSFTLHFSFIQKCTPHLRFILALFLTRAADAIKIERMVHNFEIQQLAHHCFNVLNARVAKLNDFTTIHAYNMIVLFRAVAFFVEREVFTKLMLSHEVATDQEFEGVINRRAAHAVALVFHMNIQSFGIKMVVAFVYFFEDGVAFGRFSKATFFEMRRENMRYLLNNIRFVSIKSHYFLMKNPVFRQMNEK